MCCPLPCPIGKNCSRIVELMISYTIYLYHLRESIQKVVFSVLLPERCNKQCINFVLQASARCRKLVPAPLNKHNGQSESNAACSLFPYIHFYGNKCYISTVLAHSQSYSLGYNCFTQHLAAPQLILEWQELMCL